MTRTSLTLKNLAICAGLAVGMVTFATPAFAVNVVNGNFTQYNPTISTGAPGNTSGTVYNYSTFSSGTTPTSFLTGWSIATASPGNSGSHALGFVYSNAAGEAANLNSPYGGGFTLDTSSITVPTGTNFLAVDGGAANTLAIYQTLTTIAGATYTVSFEQAGAQQSVAQTGQSGATTDYWQVGFNADTGGSFIPSTTALTSGLGATTYQDSTTINVASNGYTSWTSQSLTFTATSTSTVLSFLAVGTPAVPPMVLLDGVSVTQVAATPEPSTIGMGLLGFAGLVAARRARNKRA